MPLLLNGVIRSAPWLVSLVAHALKTGLWCAGSLCMGKPGWMGKQGNAALVFGCLALAAEAQASEWPKDHYPLPDAGNMVGEIYRVQAEYEDTLVDIARDHNVGYEEIIRANPDVSIWVPGEGTEVVIPGRHILPDAERTGIVINLAELRLYYYPLPEENEVARVETYPIGIGRDGYNTPLGTTETTMRLKDPAWYPPESMREEAAAEGEPPPDVVPPGPDNPLGKHAILLDIPGYLIHGTNQPDGIGMRASRGCIRMFPEDIESIFGRVPEGTQVTIIDAPIKLGFDGQGVPHLQAFAALGKQENGMATLLGMLSELNQHPSSEQDVDFERFSQALESSNGDIVPLI